MADKIEELRKKKQEIDKQASEKKQRLDARIRQIQGAQNRKDRKLDNRMKLLEGVALRAWVAKGRMSEDEYRKLLDEGLTLNRDRELFKLPPQNAPESASAPAPEKPREEPRKVQEQETPGKEKEERIYLRTAYNDRKEVKALGAKWDPEPVKAWYVLAGVDLEPFKRWLPSEAVPASIQTPTAPPSPPAAQPSGSEAEATWAGTERRKEAQPPPDGKKKRKTDKHQAPPQVESSQ